MRISTSQIYTSTLRHMNDSLSDYMELNTMNSSQKKLDTPSDDPWGAARVVELRSTENCLGGWIDNCGYASDMLATSDSVLQQASEQITASLEIAEQAATETYTDVQMQAMAIEVRQYTDTLYSLANSDFGGEALFAGNDLDQDAYEVALGVTIQDDALAAGDVAAVTGEAESGVWVQFDTAGAAGVDEIGYRWSDDGGEIWTAETLAAGDTVLACGDCFLEMAFGAVVTVADGEGEGAGLVIRSTYAYTGASRATSLEIAENSSVEVTQVGSDVFGGLDASGQPHSEPNLFETLADLAACLDIGDSEGAGECLEQLQACQESLLADASEVGVRENRASFAASNQAQMRELVVAGISRREDADATQILVELNQAEYVYQAVLSSTTTVMNLNLLNFL